VGISAQRLWSKRTEKTASIHFWARVGMDSKFGKRIKDINFTNHLNDREGWLCMDRVIMEELIRSVPTFFFAFIITIFLGAQFGLTTAPLYVVMGVPLIITVVSFSIFVYKRKSTGKEYKLKRGSTPYKVTMAMGTLAAFGFTIFGVRDVIYGDITGLFWTGIGILAIIIGLKEFRKTR